MQSIKDILLAKSEKKELAHFYILRGPQTEHDLDGYLKEWMHDFLISFVAQQKPTSLEKAKSILNFDVADIYQLKKKALTEKAMSSMS